MFENEAHEYTTIAIYTRKSYREDVGDKILTPYKQRKACLAYLKEHPELKWRVLPTKYMDKDAKGDTVERAAYRAVIRDAALQMFQVLMIYSIDRLFTNISELIDELDALERCGIRLFCVNEDRFVTSDELLKPNTARDMILRNMPWLAPSSMVRRANASHPIDVAAYEEKHHLPCKPKRLFVRIGKPVPSSQNAQDRPSSA